MLFLSAFPLQHAACIPHSFYKTRQTERDSVNSQTPPSGLVQNNNTNNQKLTFARSGGTSSSQMSGSFGRLARLAACTSSAILRRISWPVCYPRTTAATKPARSSFPRPKKMTKKESTHKKERKKKKNTHGTAVMSFILPFVHIVRHNLWNFMYGCRST